MIQAVKQNEQARQEYRFMSAFEMDAREEGEARGAHRKALETAKLMRTHNYPIAEICTMTGLTQEEVESV